MKFLPILALAGLLGGAARADDTITLVLPPSEPPPAKAAPAVSQPRTRNHAPLASRGRTAPSRVVGRLGVVVTATQAYAQPPAESRFLANAPAEIYVAITQERSGWYCILMDDETPGWIPAASVRLLDYEVVRAEPADGSPRGGYAINGASLSAAQNAVLQDAFRYLGVRYSWGGNGFAGIDCSGLIKNCFRTVGMDLPRRATEQMAYGAPVPFDKLQPADRLYFGYNPKTGRVTHTGLYIGNDYFIHAASSLGGVGVSRLSDPKWAKMLYAARR